MRPTFRFFLIALVMVVGSRFVRADPIPADRFIVLTFAEETPINIVPPILERELMRQSLLLTARDDLALWTRDEALSEAMPAVVGDLDSRRVAIRVQSSDKGKILNIGFSGRSKSGQMKIEVPVLHSNRYPDAFIPDLSKLAVQAEELSRKDFAQWLRNSGFAGSSKPMQPTTEIPPDLEARLGELTIFGQYDAVRKAHLAIAINGPSPAMLEVLARGYANLGQLTRFHWTASSDVFVARSLLYAQRLVNIAPNRAAGRWSRAYALAFAGLHAAALEDLDATKNAANPPPWVEMLDAMCRYETPKLAELGTKPDQLYAPFSRFMAFLTVENSNCDSLVIELGRAVLEVAPLCDRVADAMMVPSHFREMNSLTNRAFDDMITLFRQELPRISDLPGSVKTAWTAAHDNPDLMADIGSVSRSFVDTTEPAEPSWSLLGKMLQESNFIHVFRRTEFIGSEQEKSPSDFVQQTSPLVEGHRFAPLIHAYDDQFNQRDLSDELKQIPFDDVTFRFPTGTFWEIIKNKRDDYSAFYDLETHHFNATAWDCESNILTGFDAPYATSLREDYTRQVWSISPYSPAGPAGIVKWNLFLQQKDAAAETEQLKVQFAQEPAFLWTLAGHYLDIRRMPEAVSTLQAFLRLHNDDDALHDLAQCYLTLNDEPHWLETMNQALAIEDIGTENAETQRQVALHLMSEMKYAQAKAYADIAGAAGGWQDLVCAAQCCSGLGQWDRAESLLQYEGQTYGGIVWYMWTCESGQGHPDDALNAQELHRLLPNDFATIAILHGKGETKEELNSLRKLVADNSHNRFDAMWLVILEEQSGNHKAANDLLTSMRNPAYGDTKSPLDSALNGLTVALLRLQGLVPRLAARRSVAAIRSGVPIVMLDPLDQLMTLAQEHNPVIDAFIGEYLLGPVNHPQQGLECLKMASLNSTLDDYGGFMARMELIKHHIDPFHPIIPTTQPSTQPMH